MVAQLANVYISYHIAANVLIHYPRNSRRSIYTIHIPAMCADSMSRACTHCRKSNHDSTKPAAHLVTQISDQVGTVHLQGSISAI